MNSFCTIIDENYIPFANVLFASLVKSDPAARLQVLIVTSTEPSAATRKNSTGIQYYFPDEILKEPVAKKIYDKYASTNNDHFRWALKPVFMAHLLRNGFEKIIFVDPDIYFVNSSAFLFSELDSHGILLSPHWGMIDPLRDEDGLFSMLRNGLYSGGMIGATTKGLTAIDQWAELCHYKMEKRQELGLYDDQKYLDLLPLVEESTGILRHKGCNLASINIHSCKREIVQNRLVIDGRFDPIFIHFTRDTIVNIQNLNDALLKPYLDAYMAELKNEGVQLMQVLGPEVSIKKGIYYTIKHKLRFRTRIKKLFYKLAEKL